MIKRVLHLIFSFQCICLLATDVYAEGEGDVSAVEKVCEGENLGQQHRVQIDASQLAILEYDRVSELLFFNIYKGIEFSPTLQLKTSLKGLAFSMKPEQAINITRLYSMGVYKMELLFLPTKMEKTKHFCEVHKKQNILNIALLRISLLDEKGVPFQSIHTKRGRTLKAQETHAVQSYHHKSHPNVIIEIGGDALTKGKVEKLKKAITQPLFRCYREALEKNGRYQGSIIFRFEKGKVRAIHSNKNIAFGNCVTKSIEENLPINFEKKITFKTIFRLERK